MNRIQPGKLPNPIKEQESWFSIGEEDYNTVYITHENKIFKLAADVDFGHYISSLLDQYNTENMSFTPTFCQYSVCQLIWNELERLENEKIHIKMEEMKAARYKKHCDALQAKWDSYHTILQTLGLE